jgi:hypothetical protein
MRQWPRVDWHVRLLAISNLPNLLISLSLTFWTERVIQDSEAVLAALFVLVIFTNLHHGTQSYLAKHVPNARSPDNAPENIPAYLCIQPRK